MFCENCRVEIPPAWVRVIAKNECPSCGECIMSDKTKKLLEELKSAMERMPNDPEGLAGWLLSNYKLVKIGDAEPTQVFHRGQAKQVVEEELTGLKQAPNNVQEFFKNAGVLKQVQQGKDLKKMAEYIRKAASGEIPDNMYPTPEQEDYQNYPVEEQYIPAQPLARKALENNSLLLPSEGNLTPLDNKSKLQMMQLMNQEDNSNDIHPILQQQRMIKLEKQKAALNGTGKGSFRRG